MIGIRYLTHIFGQSMTQLRYMENTYKYYLNFDNL